MATLVRSPVGDNDCVLTTIATAVGLPYDEVRRAANGLFRSHGLTLAETQEVLGRLGHECRWMTWRSFDAEWDKAFRFAVWGRRAIIFTRDMDAFAQIGHREQHAIYWDGERLYDERYSRLDQIIPAGIILFKEEPA
jgi:hypothetical protein